MNGRSPDLDSTQLAQPTLAEAFGRAMRMYEAASPVAIDAATWGIDGAEQQPEGFERAYYLALCDLSLKRDGTYESHLRLRFTDEIAQHLRLAEALGQDVLMEDGDAAILRRREIKRALITGYVAQDQPQVALQLVDMWQGEVVPNDMLVTQTMENDQDDDDEDYEDDDEEDELLVYSFVGATGALAEESSDELGELLEEHRWEAVAYNKHLWAAGIAEECGYRPAIELAEEQLDHLGGGSPWWQRVAAWAIDQHTENLDYERAIAVIRRYENPKVREMKLIEISRDAIISQSKEGMFLIAAELNRTNGDQTQFLTCHVVTEHVLPEDERPSTKQPESTHSKAKKLRKRPR